MNEASGEIAAALRRFPDRSEEVARLSQRDEAFRDMCEELAAAEEALSRLESDRSAVGMARRTECEGWIARLTEEMTAALRSAGAVSPEGARRRR